MKNIFETFQSFFWRCFIKTFKKFRGAPNLPCGTPKSLQGAYLNRRSAIRCHHEASRWFLGAPKWFCGAQKCFYGTLNLLRGVPNLLHGSSKILRISHLSFFKFSGISIDFNQIGKNDTNRNFRKSVKNQKFLQNDFNFPFTDPYGQVTWKDIFLSIKSYAIH